MAQRSVLLIKHLDYETGGRAAQAVSLLPTREVVFPTELPPLEEIAGVIAFGGQMAADELEAYPSLGLTIDLLRRATEAQIPVLGLCLGHQMLGVALGGELRPGTVEEAGRVPVEVIAAEPWLGGYTGELNPVQWHNDQVTLPSGASLLARNEACENQAFRLGSAVGLQFHLEVDARVLRLWRRFAAMDDDLGGPAAGDRLAAEFDADQRLAQVATAGLDAFAAACRARLEAAA